MDDAISEASLETKAPELEISNAKQAEAVPTYRQTLMKDNILFKLAPTITFAQMLENGKNLEVGLNYFDFEDQDGEDLEAITVNTEADHLSIKESVACIGHGTRGPLLVIGPRSFCFFSSCSSPASPFSMHWPEESMIDVEETLIGFSGVLPATQ